MNLIYKTFWMLLFFLRSSQIDANFLPITYNRIATVTNYCSNLVMVIDRKCVCIIAVILLCDSFFSRRGGSIVY